MAAEHDPINTSSFNGEAQNADGAVNSLEQRLHIVGDGIFNLVAELGGLAFMLRHPSAQPLTAEGVHMCHELGHALRAASELIESVGDFAVASAQNAQDDEPTNRDS